MKICIAQQNYHIGNFEQNTEKILGAIEAAKNQGADFILFSEMSVCGYPARDFVEFEDFINKCYQSIDAIKQAADTIGVLIGSPARNPNKKGKDLYNAAFSCMNKKWSLKFTKHYYLPTTFLMKTDISNQQTNGR